MISPTSFLPIAIAMKKGRIVMSKLIFTHLVQEVATSEAERDFSADEAAKCS